jgi:hypothetical protein
MYMNRKPFDHIDNMFREAAENFQPAVTPQAWEKMEQLLDKSGRKRRPVFWFWPLLLILITGGAGVYFFQDSPVVSKTAGEEQRVSALTPQQKETKNQGKRGMPLTADIPDNRENADPLSTSEKINADRTVTQGNPPAKGDISQASESVTPRSAVTKKDMQRTDKEKLSPDREPSPEVQSIAGRKKSNRITGNRPAAKTANKDLVETIKNVDALTPNSEKPGQPLQNIKQDTNVTSNELAQGSKVKQDDTPDSSTVVKQSPANDTASLVKEDVTANKTLSEKIPAGLYYIVSFSGDGNGMKQFSTNNFAIGYGIAVGYQLNRRWGIQAGISGSNKKYAAGGKDYYFKPGSYYDTVNMRKIDAACYIVEIPLSVRYNVIQKNKSAVYAVAGLSSYLMKKEAYDYYYTYHNTWPASPHKASYTYAGNNHFFSIVNLSVGYERKLFPMLSLQAEPYVRVPLSGVGEGKVHLYSAGLQLSFKWQRMKTIQPDSR